MASTSGTRRRVLLPNEILTSLDSEDDSSSGEDDLGFVFRSELDNNSDSEDYSEEEEPVPKRKRGKSNPNVTDISWKDGPFVPTVFPFDSTVSGLKSNIPIDNNSTELDVFSVFFDNEIMSLIVQETNSFYAFTSSTVNVKEKSRLHKWFDTSIEEMFMFLSIVILMGYLKKLKISDYWSTDPLISTPIFGKMMGSDRFFLLLRMLHFSSNTDQNTGGKLQKISKIIELLKNKYVAVFSPFQDLCIDESLMLWKGRLSFRQYIPTKRHRFGVKLFILCDCQTGFILDFIVYSGSQTELEKSDESLGMSGEIVLTLMKQYLGKGHKLFTDNWYTSPTLCKFLYDNKTGSCGTAKSNRVGFPKNFTPKMKKGDLEEKHTNTTLPVKWHDKRAVHMLTTVNDTGVESSGKIDRQTSEEIMKPKCVLEYNKKMGLVDKSDMQISFSEFQRKTVKWYKKLFFHLLDITVYNAYVIYKMLSRKNPQLSEYRLELVRQILGKYHKPRKCSKGGRPSAGDDPLRLTERHFIQPIPATQSKDKPYRKCHVCLKTNKRIRKKKETRYMCAECDMAMCLNPCFKDYHTEKVY